MKSTPSGLPEQPALQRTLSNRHIQLMAMGGAIGTGLFMGSGKIIALSGTSIILIYMIIGLFVFFVMRAMGEMLLSNLNFKTFADFAGAYLGPTRGVLPRLVVLAELERGGDRRRRRGRRLLPVLVPRRTGVDTRRRHAGDPVRTQRADRQAVW
jgi:hypothetical protein